MKRVTKRWNSNVLAYTFTLFKVVYSMHFLFKSLKPNNSKGYEVYYTCFAPTFTPDPTNQTQRDMDHEPFLGNPKADRSEAEGFWGGSISLILLFHESVFI